MLRNNRRKTIVITAVIITILCSSASATGNLYVVHTTANYGYRVESPADWKLFDADTLLLYIDSQFGDTPPEVYNRAVGAVAIGMGSFLLLMNGQETAWVMLRPLYSSTTPVNSNDIDAYINRVLVASGYSSKDDVQAGKTRYMVFENDMIRVYARLSLYTLEGVVVYNSDALNQDDLNRILQTAETIQCHCTDNTLFYYKPMLNLTFLLSNEWTIERLTDYISLTASDKNATVAIGIVDTLTDVQNIWDLYEVRETYLMHFFVRKSMIPDAKVGTVISNPFRYGDNMTFVIRHTDNCIRYDMYFFSLGGLAYYVGITNEQLIDEPSLVQFIESLRCHAREE